jgi:hypothetical protein
LRHDPDQIGAEADDGGINERKPENKSLQARQ